MSDCDRFVHFSADWWCRWLPSRPCSLSSVPANRLSLDGDDIIVEVRGQLDPHDAEQLKNWKHHCMLLLRYTATDEHLCDDSISPPLVGPIVIRRPS